MATRRITPPRNAPGLASKPRAWLGGIVAEAGRILVVEAEATTRQLLAYDLEAAGHEVMAAQSAAEGLQVAHETHPDVILSELTLPDGSGAEFCSMLRRERGLADTLFIVLSARSEDGDRAHAFESGVDHYLSKPFSPRELVLRIRAMLRRRGAAKAPSTLTDVGCLRLDAAAYRAWVEGREVELTTTEFQILLALCENFDRVLTRERLIEHLGKDGVIGVRTVDAHMRRLRVHLGAAGRYIDTVRGVGYRLSYERGVRAAAGGARNDDDSNGTPLDADPPPQCGPPRRLASVFSATELSFGGRRRVLLIAASSPCGETLERALRAANYEVLVATNVERGLNRIRETRPDLVLCDSGFPDRAGGELCALLRREPRIEKTPFILLSRLSSELDCIQAFQQGVDDFITKPFGSAEVVLRVGSLLRRCARFERVDAMTTLGRIRIDAEARRVWVDGAAVHLTHSEWRILLALYENLGRPLNRDRLVEILNCDGVSGRAVDAHMRRLRRSLGSGAEYVKTRRGVGYLLAPGDVADGGEWSGQADG